MPIKIKAAVIKIKAAADKIKAAPEHDKIKAADAESFVTDLESFFEDEPDSVDKLKASIIKIKASVVKIKAKIKANEATGDLLKEVAECCLEFEKNDWVNSLADENLREKIVILEKINVEQAIEIYRLKNGS